MGYRTSSARRSSAQSAVASSIAVINSSTGPILTGGGVTSTTTFQTQVTTPGSTTTTNQASGTGPTITTLTLTDSSYNPISNTALDAGSTGYIILTGTGFKTGCTAYINGVAQTTNFISSTQVNCQLYAEPVGTYSLMLFNTDGSGAIYLNIPFSSVPSWTTSSSLGNFYETVDPNYQLAASGDTPLTYTLYSGSLPTGASLSSSGLISGATAAEAGSTSYNFVVKVTDPQGQYSLRVFSLTVNVDVVSWSTPANLTTYNVPQNSAISSVSLSASSAAGYSVSYSADQLPSGVSLSGSSITGTPTVVGSTTTQLTATAATTNRSATRTIYWTVSIASDTYFPYTSLLINADTGSNLTNTANNHFFLDGSSSPLSVTRFGSASQGSFTPFSPTGWSLYCTGTGTQLATSTSVTALGTNDFTIEMWINLPSTSTRQCLITNRTGSVATDFMLEIGVTANKLMWHTSAGSVSNPDITGTTTISPNTWTHIAVVRISNALRIYVNGALDSATTSTTWTGSISDASAIQIGSYSTSYVCTGYISNVRVVNTLGVYTGAFTPPTTPLTATQSSGTNIAAITSGKTILLTCQSNRSLDNGTNALGFTTGTGNPIISAFSPFAASASYSTATNGGSGYFNGSSDYLQVGTSANASKWAFSGDFTIEAWLYPFNTTASDFLSTWVSGTASSSCFICSINSVTGKTRFSYGVGATNTNVDSTLTGVVPNAWNHIAFKIGRAHV